jgi:hypothetical protein
LIVGQALPADSWSLEVDEEERQAQPALLQNSLTLYDEVGHPVEIFLVGYSCD